MKKQNGITLIALVISIIVMLILTGVSINAVIGDNGVIGKAQKATTIQNCALLQEYLEMYYVSNFDKMPEANTRLEALMNYTESSSWIYQPIEHGYGTLNYIVNEEGKICYLIDKNQLPDDIRSQIKSGDAGDKTYKDYYQMNDVYGVTEDLKVYYCSNGYNTLVAAVDINLVDEDLLREVFPAGSTLATIINGNTDENVTFEGSKTVSELTITGESGITNLKEFYNLQGLKKLILENMELDSLDGIEEAYKLKQVYFKNCKINDYSALNKMQKRLTHLYCYLDPTFAEAQNEVDKFLSEDKGILNGEFEKLAYFGIFGNTQYIDNNNFSWQYSGNPNSVTDLSQLGNLTDTTKKAIKYLYLQSNGITTIEYLKDFENVLTLALCHTNIATLNGVQNMNKLNYLVATYTALGINESETEKNENTDALSYIRYNSSESIALIMQYNTYLRYAGYLENLNASMIYLTSCPNLDLEDLSLLTDLYIQGLVQVASTQGKAFNNDIRLDYYNNGTLTNTSEEISKIDGNTDLKYLRLDYQTGLTDNVTEGKTFTEILSGCTSLQTLSLIGCTGLTSIDFVKYMPNLVELDIRGCTGITDLSVLETQTNAGKLNLETLRINNSAIDITKIQNTISNLDGEWIQTIDGEQVTVSHTSRSFIDGSTPLYFYATNAIYAQLSNCTEITALRFRYDGPSTMDFSGMTSLKSIDSYGGSGTWTLPDSLETLYLGHNRKIIQGLTSNSALKTVSIVCSSLTNDDWKIYFENLSNCSSLTTLELALRDSKIEELDMSTLNNPSIKELKIAKYNNATLKKIYGFTENLSGLTTLSIYNFNDLKEISGLNNMKAITDLAIYNTQFSDLTEIGYLTKLKNLVLNNNAITALKPLENLTELENLNLESNNITDRSAYLNANGETVQYNNLDILANLNKKALIQCLLQGNKGIIDDSKIANLKWPNGYSFGDIEEVVGAW